LQPKLESRIRVLHKQDKLQIYTKRIQRVNAVRVEGKTVQE